MRDFIFELQRFDGTQLVPILGTEGADYRNLYNVLDNQLINALGGNDTIENKGNYVSIIGGKGDDSIINSGNNVKFYYAIGDGNDTIEGFSKQGNLTFISTRSNGLYNLLTDGINDTLTASGRLTTRETANGSITYKGGKIGGLFCQADGQGDIIFDRVSNTTIDGGGGPDEISVYAENTTILGSGGNDTLRNYADNTLFLHQNGDDNDIIYGFNETSTLALGMISTLSNGDPDSKGYYSFYKKDTVDNDIIVNVYYSKPASTDAEAEYRITLIGAASLSAVNIIGDDLLPDTTPADTTPADTTPADTTPADTTPADTTPADTTPTDTTPADNPLSITLDDKANSLNNSLDGATIQALGGNDTIQNGYYDSSVGHYVGYTNVSISGGAGNDSIINHGDSVTIDGGTGNDSIYNGNGSNVSIAGGDGDDTVYNGNGSNVLIEGGDGNDSIRNYAGNSATLIGGDGNDTIISRNDFADGGDGNDYISGRGTIDGGDGDDYISGGGTINAGTGNDTIDLNYGSHNNLIEYTAGDGNDLILGFDSSSTLKIGGGTGTYSTTTSGKNLFVCVGNDTITLVGAASLAGNIAGSLKTYTPVTPATKSITLTENADNYLTSFDGATVKALGGDDNISNAFSGVSINAGDGKDSVTNFTGSVTIDGGNGNDSIVSGYSYGGSFYINSVLINAGDGNDSIRNDYSRNITVYGGAGNDSIYDHNVSNSTIAGGDGDDSIYSSGHNVSISGGAGNDYIHNWYMASSTTINGGKGNDKINLDSNTHVYSENNLIEYTAGDGKDTVYFFDDGDTLKIGDGTGTYSTAKIGTDIIVTVGDGSILLVGAASLSAVNILGVDEETSTDEEFSWTFTNGTASYVKTNGTASETVFTISGLNSSLTADDLDSVIEVDENKITLLPEALGQKNVTLTTSGKYTLALDADCPTVTAVDKGWTLSGTTATYRDAGKSEGYKLTNSKTVTYTAAAVGKTLLTVNGVVEDLSDEELNDGFTVSGKTLTVTPEVVGDKLSVSEGYKVVFDEGDYGGSRFIGTSAKDTIEVNGNGLEIDAGKGNDTITSSGDGGNVYLFASADGKDTITGYSDADTIKITDGSAASVSVKGNDVIVTVGKGSMTLKDSAKTGAHVLIVDSTDETLIDGTYYADRIVDGNSVTLTSAFKSKSFTATEEFPAVDGSAVSGKFSLIGGDEDNTLIGGKGANFINGGGGENILTGGKGNDTFATGNGNDTITDYGVGTDKISLGADVTDFSIENGDIVLNFDDEKSLTIQNGDGKKINFVQNGKASTELFTANGRTNTQGTSITLTSSTEDYTATAKMLTIDGGLTNSVWIVGNTKANKIFGGAGDDTLNGGSGKDMLTGGDGSDIFVYESGKDTITDYVSGEDKISLSAAAISETVDKKGNVVLKFSNSNSLTINNVDGADGREITFTGEDGDTTKTYYSESIVGADGVTLQSNFTASTIAADSKLPLVDASAVTKKLTISGGDEDNTLIGGTKEDLINGGAGDDLLIGGKGNDTFVYSSGDDTIGDYDVKDRISLSSAMTNFSLENDDVIIGFDEGSLTLQDSAGKAITFVETVNGKVTSSVNVFAENGIFNNKTSSATAVTLAADTSTFNAKNYSKLVTIDGGIVSSDASIVGNAKNNLIYAGDNGATINGGKGNDSLWGGSGSDTFIYESGGGKDVVYNFGDDDALQISGTFTASVKDKSIAFKVGSTANALTLKDYSATEFNINGDAYQISGNTLAKK